MTEQDPTELINHATNEVVLVADELETLVENWDSIRDKNKRDIIENAVADLQFADENIGVGLRDLDE